MRRPASLIALLLVIAACAGCGKSEGRVSGTVTRQGRPVAAGNVNLFDPTRGTGAMGLLDGNGHFALDGTLPPGQYQVFITAPPLAPPRADGKRPTPAKPVPFELPKKYTAAATSGLTITVNPGENEVPLALPD